jgi:glucosamine--fructose-6-phosphate aminotransferase (isomerizing)
MLEEIAEQPAALEKTIAEERRKVEQLGQALARREIDLIVLSCAWQFRQCGPVRRYLLEIKTGIPVSLSAPSVHTLYQAKLNLKHALVIGVSQSGEGEDINRVLENARASGAFTIGITNEPASSMVKAG